MCEKMVDGRPRSAGNGPIPELTPVSELHPENLHVYDFEKLHVNRSALNPPFGFSGVDCALLEMAAHRIQDDTDDWEAAEEPLPERVWGPAPLTEREIAIEGRLGRADRPFDGALGAYVRLHMDKSIGEERATSCNIALEHIL